MPRIICIAGRLAAGKTTLVRQLEKALNAAALLFDEYEAFGIWPEDLQHWLDEGADPSAVSNPRLHDDLSTLLNGESVLHPQTGEAILPAETILLEDPFGRTRREIAPLIDHVLFVELPSDLSVARLMQRALGFDSLDTDPGAVEQLARAEVDRRLIAAQRWIVYYIQRREMYAAASDRVRSAADVVLDGGLSRDALLDVALDAIRNA